MGRRQTRISEKEITQSYIMKIMTVFLAQKDFQIGVPHIETTSVSSIARIVEVEFEYRIKKNILPHVFGTTFTLVCMTEGNLHPWRISTVPFEVSVGGNSIAWICFREGITRAGKATCFFSRSETCKVHTYHFPGGAIVKKNCGNIMAAMSNLTGRKYKLQFRLPHKPPK